ncbi:MFS general substrate transporter [Pluteus cervinus]|uniref:MFS general substrate transporter n=1 Tax=Pluteus cervinus TaxID=181527 RepID=A0ACD3BCF3_9AGAR|nr:MFS general substrate transporter [Pluteus cervinus]
MMALKSSEKNFNGEASHIEVVIEPQAIGITPAPPKFPEGGRDGWLTLAGATLVQFATFGYTNAFGVYQDYYVREYLTNHTPASIGWIGGAQIFFIFSIGLLTGRLFDRGYFRHLMIAGLLLQILSYFSLSFSKPGQYYQVFVSQGLGGGLSVGLFYLPSLAVVSHHFQQRRPLAMGIVASGSALGAVLHPIMLNKLFHNSIGFHNGIRISAGMNTVLLIIANFCMKTRLPPKKNDSNTKESPIAFLQFLKEPAYLLQAIAGCLFVCGLFFPVFYIQLDAAVHGVDPNIAFYAIPILNAASIPGRLLPGLIVSKYGVFNVMIFFTSVMGILLLSMITVKDVVGVVVFAILYGFFSGGGIAMMPPLLASSAKDFNEIGTRIGLVFLFGGFAGLTATPIAGALLTSQFHWWRPMVYAGSTMLGGALFFALSRHVLAKQKGTHII